MEQRTVGRVYGGHRPSELITLTLAGYGAVHTARKRGNRTVRCGCGRLHRADDPVLGAPVDYLSYDYRRAARDAIHFARLLDRFWQNLRRAVGWEVQYFSCVEAQRRLAAHTHAAVRGTIPRTMVRRVAAATYHQVWWPEHGDPVYGGDRVPVWSHDRKAFCDPETGAVLPTFDESLPGADDDPAHVVRFGDQIDVRGFIGGTPQARKVVGYITKYLTKSVGETHTDSSTAHRRHADRLLAELAITPCSPRCPVWLLHGIQPRGARSTVRPGECRGGAHKWDTLGVVGRRVLTSRKWSGKTIEEHRHDRHAFVRQLLDSHSTSKDANETARQAHETGRYRWEPVAPTDPDMPPRPYLLLMAIAERNRWRAEYRAALASTGSP